MKKSLLRGLVITALTTLLIVGGTMAWFTASAGPVENKFTAGTVKIDLVDQFNEVTNWNPGDCTDKVVYVENTGTKCAFVRVKLDVAWEDGLPDGNVKLYYKHGDTKKLLSEHPDWELCGDYYYYVDKSGPQTLIAPGPCPQYPLKQLAGKATSNSVPARTSNLLDMVCLDGAGTDNTYQGKKFSITVNAEAIQCTNGAAEVAWFGND